ncbi:MAG: transposase [Verrucomicrobiota bacterium]
MRPPRLSNVWLDNPTYFITTNVEKRSPVLATPEVANILMQEWRSAFERHSWAIGRYVIMPDHVHFFCSSLEQKKSLSHFMRQWKEWTSKTIKRSTQLTDFKWQEGFVDHVLRNHESRSEKWEYIRQNPVRAGLVENPKEWPHKGFIDFD